MATQVFKVLLALIVILLAVPALLLAAETLIR